MGLLRGVGNELSLSPDPKLGDLITFT